MSEEQLRDLPRYAASPHFDPAEKAVLRFAAEMTLTPAMVSDEAFAALREHLSERQILELAAGVAWENFRARFNRALGVEAESFSQGRFCALPELPPVNNRS